MLHHVSFTAGNPRRVAEVLASLIGGRVSRFGPWEGGFIAWAPDEVGTAIEIYPQGTEIITGEGSDQARFQHNYFASKQSSTHAAISVVRTEDEVFATASNQGWRAVRQDRGGFDVIELWVEDTVMLEILTPAMMNQYLSVVKSPHIAASGDTSEPLVLKVDVGTEPDTLFRAWTSAENLQKWWPIPEAHIDLRIGGRYELLFLPERERGLADRDRALSESEAGHGSRGSENCRILSYIPGKMISFTWNSPSHLGLRDSQTWVVLEFTETETGTEVSLTHCGFLEGEQWDQCRAYFQQAWRRLLRRLAAHWDQGVDLRTPRTPPQAASATPPEQRRPDQAPVIGESTASPVEASR